MTTAPRGARPTGGALGAVDDVEIYLTATADVTGFFEVEIIGGDMLHSRMNGDGFVDSQKKMDKIIVDPKGTRIHDSIFDSVRELVNDVIPACNIEGSKELVRRKVLLNYLTT